MRAVYIVRRQKETHLSQVHERERPRRNRHEEEHHCREGGRGVEVPHEEEVRPNEVNGEPFLLMVF